MLARVTAAKKRDHEHCVWSLREFGIYYNTSFNVIHRCFAQSVAALPVASELCIDRIILCLHTHGLTEPARTIRTGCTFCCQWDTEGAHEAMLAQAVSV